MAALHTNLFALLLDEHEQGRAADAVASLEEGQLDDARRLDDLRLAALCDTQQVRGRQQAAAGKKG